MAVSFDYEQAFLRRPVSPKCRRPFNDLVIEIKGHDVQRIDNSSYLAFLVTPAGEPFGRPRRVGLCMRMAQQRLLARRRIGDQGPTVPIARRNEARCHPRCHRAGFMTGLFAYVAPAPLAAPSAFRLAHLARCSGARWPRHDDWAAHAVAAARTAGQGVAKNPPKPRTQIPRNGGVLPSIFGMGERKANNLKAPVVVCYG